MNSTQVTWMQIGNVYDMNVFKNERGIMINHRLIKVCTLFYDFIIFNIDCDNL